MARLLGSAWQDGGGVNGLAALFWEPGRAQVALPVDQAIDGAFRAAAASTVKAVGGGVATGLRSESWEQPRWMRVQRCSRRGARYGERQEGHVLESHSLRQ